MATPAAVVGGLAMTTLALRLRDPHVAGSWGFCPSAALGFWCPGCGGLRAVNDLTHGQVLDAASSNLLLVALLPLAVAALGYWVVQRWRGRSGRWPDVLVLGSAGLVCAVAVLFAVLRNGPVPWLAP